jgi:hypothetical protein
MSPNQNTDTASDLGQPEKKHVRKAVKTARKARKNGTRRTNGSARTRSAKTAFSKDASRFLESAKSSANDAYGWSGDTTRKMTNAARKAGLPREYANERSLIIAAVGLGVSVAVGALLMGYGSLGGKSSPGASTSPKRSRRKS